MMEATTEGMIAVTTVFGKRRTQIPLEICKRFQIKDGDKVVWIIDSKGNITVRKIESAVKEDQKVDREFTREKLGIMRPIQ